MRTYLATFATICMFCQGCSVSRIQPVQHDSTVIRYYDSLRVKDSLVLVPIPAESSSQVAFPPDTSHLETNVAKSDAWVDSSGRLHHSLSNKAEEKLPVLVPIRDRARAYEKQDYLMKTVTEYVDKELTRWQKIWIALGKTLALTLILGTVLLIARLSKKH